MRGEAPLPAHPPSTITNLKGAHVALYILRRVGITVLMVFLVVSAAFFLVALMPNDVTQTILGPDATPEARAQLRDEMGFNDPILVRYLAFLGGLLTGDLGVSYLSQQSVTMQVLERLPVTLTLSMGGILLTTVLGIVLGILAASRGGWLDTIIRGAAGVMQAIPSFWLAVLLVLVFAVNLKMFPASGWEPFTEDPAEFLRRITLPLISIGIAGTAAVARQARVAMLDVQGRDFMQTLRATGLPEWRIVWLHGLRNAAIPVLTVIGLQFVALFGSAVLIEQVFALPGVGKLVVDSVNLGDMPIVLGVVVALSVVILVMNLVIDILYGIINPKARLA
ncbi:ABC transporter permease [Pseudoclavibacter sp. RFBJ3]|nr:ABC transporter permease [Pseudoclavibacter sp. Z016]PPF80885.1 ABC transporter permease [Pseudoclavibacter sp. RFBJ5]PPF94394.1 ABC transporter permease [Pseudoclavibacter sp. RFBJ3]PPF99501.1 ABC transporter permease [Pseudoclavibacter sp. RFBH5]PPG00658.1 ABC transporter permease [Pseudoclavibacter sp. RFBI5]PPG25695.1 ABC transporter permease [Pseudoclavibacter sp. RFBI4]